MATYAGVALVAMAPLGLALSGLAATMALIVNPLSWVIGGLGYLAYLNWDKIVFGVKGFAGGLKDNLGPETAKWVTKISDSIGALFDRISGAGSDMSNADAYLFGRQFGIKTAKGIEKCGSARSMAHVKASAFVGV